MAPPSLPLPGPRRAASAPRRRRARAVPRPPVVGARSIRRPWCCWRSGTACPAGPARRSPCPRSRPPAATSALRAWRTRRPRGTRPQRSVRGPPRGRRAARPPRASARPPGGSLIPPPRTSPPTVPWPAPVPSSVAPFPVVHTLPVPACRAVASVPHPADPHVGTGAVPTPPEMISASRARSADVGPSHGTGREHCCRPAAGYGARPGGTACANAAPACRGGSSRANTGRQPGRRKPRPRWSR